MTELDPEIWKNATLGSATDNQYLDEVEAQALEDRRARIEQREPLTAVHYPRYPQLPPSGSVPSEVTQIEFIEPGSEIPPDPTENTPPVADDDESSAFNFNFNDTEEDDK